MRVRFFARKCGRKQLNYMVSDWLNKNCAYHALAMRTLDLISVQVKRDSLHFTCLAAQNRLFTPKKNGFQAVLKAVMYLPRHCGENGPGLGVKCPNYSLLHRSVYLSGIALCGPCSSQVDNKALVRQPL